METDGDSGDSVVPLHGGFGTAIQWRHQISALATRFRVSAPERRAHWRTRDYEGPISFDIYAQDTIEFLELPEVGPSHLIGHSDGAIIGTLVAIQRPDLVRKLVPMGVYANRAGIHPEVVRSMESMTVDKSLKFEREQYEKLSPDGPDHWPIVFDKISRMWREEPDIPLTQLRVIEGPTLIVQADDDVAKEIISTRCIVRSQTVSWPLSQEPLMLSFLKSRTSSIKSSSSFFLSRRPTRGCLSVANITRRRHD